MGAALLLVGGREIRPRNTDVAEAPRHHRKLLALNDPTMSQLGQRRTYTPVILISGLPPRADIVRQRRLVRFVPISEVVPYSITSSARVRSVGGTMMPSAFAVFKLITSSSLVGRSTGRSAGFAPLTILSTKTADRRN